jgi:hypothetical protein
MHPYIVCTWGTCPTRSVSFPLMTSPTDVILRKSHLPLNNFTDFRDTRYEHYTARGHHTFLLFNFLLSVTSKIQSFELPRWECYSSLKIGFRNSVCKKVFEKFSTLDQVIVFWVAAPCSDVVGLPTFRRTLLPPSSRWCDLATRLYRRENLTSRNFSSVHVVAQYGTTWLPCENYI